MLDSKYCVLALLEADGDIKERYEYTPQGKRQVFISAGANDPTAQTPMTQAPRAGAAKAYALCDIGFQGLMHDEVTGNIHQRAREYSPRLARFYQRDPLGYPDGPNSYAAYHVLMMGTDPSGQAVIVEMIEPENGGGGVGGDSLSDLGWKYVEHYPSTPLNGGGGVGGDSLEDLIWDDGSQKTRTYSLTIYEDFDLTPSGTSYGYSNFDFGFDQGSGCSSTESPIPLINRPNQLKLGVDIFSLYIGLKSIESNGLDFDSPRTYLDLTSVAGNSGSIATDIAIIRLVNTHGLDEASMIVRNSKFLRFAPGISLVSDIPTIGYGGYEMWMLADEAGTVLFNDPYYCGGGYTLIGHGRFATDFATDYYLIEDIQVAYLGGTTDEIAKDALGGGRAAVTIIQKDGFVGYLKAYWDAAKPELGL